MFMPCLQGKNTFIELFKRERGGDPLTEKNLILVGRMWLTNNFLSFLAFYSEFLFSLSNLRTEK